jgi:hypothetical protein
MTDLVLQYAIGDTIPEALNGPNEGQPSSPSDRRYDGVTRHIDRLADDAKS